MKENLTPEQTEANATNGGGSDLTGQKYLHRGPDVVPGPEFDTCGVGGIKTQLWEKVPERSFTCLHIKPTSDFLISGTLPDGQKPNLSHTVCSTSICQRFYRKCRVKLTQGQRSQFPLGKRFDANWRTSDPQRGDGPQWGSGSHSVFL